MTRNGVKFAIDSLLLVPGDLVYLMTGDRVPADMILTASRDCKVCLTAVTGETNDMERCEEVDGSRSYNIFEAQNTIFYGSVITQGSCEGIVFRTGDNMVLALVTP